MGVKCTHDIKRQLAIDIIHSKINEASNDELSNMLECFEKESEYRNYWICDEDVSITGGCFKIESIEDFNQTF